MNTHPKIEYMIYRNRHKEDLQRAERYRLADDISPHSARPIRRFFAEFRRTIHAVKVYMYHLQAQIVAPDESISEAITPYDETIQSPS